MEADVGIERPPKWTRNAFRNLYRCRDCRHRWMTMGIGGKAGKRHELFQECRNCPASRTVVSVKQEDGSWAEEVT